MADTNLCDMTFEEIQNFMTDEAIENALDIMDGKYLNNVLNHNLINL